MLSEGIETKKTLLRDLYETMILKDIAKTFSIEDIKSLEDFTRFLSINTGSLLSYETVSKNLKISFQTVKKYLDAMEKSYLIIKAQPFYTNKNKETSKQPKIYFLDTGLRNAISRTFDNEPAGCLVENYIVSELIKMGFSPKFWRTKAKAEVDFVIEKGKDIIPIEVKISADEGKIGRNMISFITNYKPKIAIVVSYKHCKNELKINGCKVIFTDAFGMKEILAK